MKQCIWALLLFAFSFVSVAQTVNTNVGGEAISITGLDVGGTLYNVTSFDGTGAGDAYYWPDAVSATAATNAVNNALNLAGVLMTNANGGASEFLCVGQTTADNNDSIPGTSNPTGVSWVIHSIGAFACTIGGLNYHTTWEVVPTGTAITNGAGDAIAITGLEIGGTIYNVTSFDGTGAGDAYFWPDAASAATAADAVNAVLNAAGVLTTHAGVGGDEFLCVGRTTADNNDSVASTSQPSGVHWEVHFIAAYACTVGGLGWHTTWEVVPPGVVTVNGDGEATSITGIEVGGILYNVTSFDGTGAGSAYFWPSAAAATEAAEAVNAVLNGVNVFEVSTVGETTADQFYCVGRTTADNLDSVGNATFSSLIIWQIDAIAAPFACTTGGLGWHATWQVVVPPAAAVIDLSPGSSSNIIHPHHDGGPNAVGGLNDLIPVVVFKQSLQVGDPVDLDTDTIDVGTLSFGPGQAGIAPNSQPVFNVDVDQDGLNDAQFEFLMGDAAFGCQDTDAALTGETTTGQTFAGSDSVSPACNAQCH